jgi:ribonuclease BN (tRNA processing enzyme)
VGPIGTGGVLDRIDAAFGGSFRTLGYEIRVREVGVEETLDLPGGVRITSRKVPHTPESVAYSIQAGNRRIVYTGDTGPDASLGEWAAGCDVLIAECSLPATMRMATHLTPEDCAELAAAARPGMLVLTHFYPPVEAVDVRAIVGERFTGPLVLATDGWTTEIEDR